MTRLEIVMFRMMVEQRDQVWPPAERLFAAPRHWPWALLDDR